MNEQQFLELIHEALNPHRIFLKQWFPDSKIGISDLKNSNGIVEFYIDLFRDNRVYYRETFMLPVSEISNYFVPQILAISIANKFKDNLVALLITIGISALEENIVRGNGGLSHSTTFPFTDSIDAKLNDLLDGNR